VFTHPHVVLTDEMLRPETQDLDVFADGVANIVATHERVAKSYFADGSLALACPPLHALLEIMANGRTNEGHGLASPEVRSLFTRESVLASDWYQARLNAKQRSDQARGARGVAALEDFVQRPGNEVVTARLGIDQRLARARAELAEVRSEAYRAGLVGTIGVQPLDG
jgi:hypothetical protein